MSWLRHLLPRFGSTTTHGDSPAPPSATGPARRSAVATRSDDVLAACQGARLLVDATVVAVYDDDLGRLTLHCDAGSVSGTPDDPTLGPAISAMTVLEATAASAMAANGRLAVELSSPSWAYIVVLDDVAA